MERVPSAWLIPPSTLSLLEAYAKIIIKKRIFSINMQPALHFQVLGVMWGH